MKEEQNSKVLHEVLKELQQLKEKHGEKERGRARSKRTAEDSNNQGSILLSSKFIEWKYFRTFISSPRSYKLLTISFSDLCIVSSSVGQT